MTDNYYISEANDPEIQPIEYKNLKQCQWNTVLLTLLKWIMLRCKIVMPMKLKRKVNQMLPTSLAWLSQANDSEVLSVVMKKV